MMDDLYGYGDKMIFSKSKKKKMKNLQIYTHKTEKKCEKKVREMEIEKLKSE